MTKQEKAPETVEIVEPTESEKVVIDEGSAKESGLSEKEIEMGKKHGVIKAEKEKAEEKEEKEEKEGKEGKKEAEEPAKEENKEITAEEIRKKPINEITEEESAKLTKTEQGYYWQQKKERAKRQTAETDRDYYKMKISALEEKLKKIEEGSGTKEEKEDEIDALFDEEEKKESNEEKTLTKEQWEEQHKREQEDIQAQRNRVNARLNEFEAEVKEKHPDLNKVLDLSTDLFNNYETIYKGDEKKIEETRAKIKEWALAAADMFKPDSKNLTELAYEIGKTHPNYKPSGKDTAEDDGDNISDDKMSKLLASQKGKTSASLSGGGSRVPVSELTLEQARNLPISEWRKIPKETRDKLMGKP